MMTMTFLVHPVVVVVVYCIRLIPLCVLSAGRRIRTELEDKFERVYYLKTLNWGALIRKWPQGFSIWQEDESLPEGYRHMEVRMKVVMAEENVGSS